MKNMRDDLFYLIYRRISNKHPTWSPKRMRATTIWCLKRRHKTK